MKLFEEAIIYATIMHQGKVRMITGTPFILHPIEVAQILSTLTSDEEVIAAGVLHDVVESTDGTIEEVRRRFGKRISNLVEACTEEDSGDEDMVSSWKRRKEDSLQVLRNSDDIGVKMLWLADKLANIRSVARIYSEMGEKTWSFFNQSDSEEQCWYYRTVAEYIEMDLNKTGAFKELIKEINFIWPGTFDSDKTRYKKLKEVSIKGCKQIGKGSKGTVYKYSDELILKVYNDKNTYKDVEREIDLSRKAFVMGLPTAISFGIVSVGDKYGSLFEIIEGKTISEHIAKDNSQRKKYARIMAELALNIHSTEVPEEIPLPDASAGLMEYVEWGIPETEADLAEILKGFIRALPPTRHLVHGDFHTGNVFLQHGEPVLIDLDRISTGHPIVDLSVMYLSFAGFGDRDPKVVEGFMGISYDVAKKFFHEFMKQYLKTNDETLIQRATDKAALIAYTRLAGRAHAKIAPFDKDEGAQEFFINRIKELVKKVDGLAI